MENASKALSIAASILIGVLLVALIVYAYYNFTIIPQREEANAKTEQTAEFNKRYEAYNKKKLTGYKLVSLCNMVIDNNTRKYNGVDDCQITIVVNSNIHNVGEDGREGRFGFTIEKNSTGYYDDVKNNIKKLTYKCTEVKYDGRDGRISLMTFEQIKNDE